MKANEIVLFIGYFLGLFTFYVLYFNFLSFGI